MSEIEITQEAIGIWHHAISAASASGIAFKPAADRRGAEVAEGSFAANKQAEQRYLASASNADSTSGRDVDLEYAVSSGRRANGDKAIATAIRKLKEG